MSEWADNYDSLATTDNGACDRLGCISDWADNYNSLATDDDGSCIRMGCIDVTAFNYDSLANTDDGSCEAIVEGCLDETAFNYNANANTQTSPSIGDIYQGGYLFYIDETGENGLVAAMEDIGEYDSGCFATSKCQD